MYYINTTYLKTKRHNKIQSQIIPKIYNHCDQERSELKERKGKQKKNKKTTQQTAKSKQTKHICELTAPCEQTNRQQVDKHCQPATNTMFGLDIRLCRCFYRMRICTGHGW